MDSIIKIIERGNTPAAASSRRQSARWSEWRMCVSASLCFLTFVLRCWLRDERM